MGVTRRYKDLVIRYSSDFNFDIPLRQRIYKTEAGDIETPVTDLLLARQVTDGCKPPRQKPFEERHSIACFANETTETGESNLRTMIPYLPGSLELKQQLAEIKNYSGVLSVTYYSEEHTLDIKRFYRVD